MIYYERLKKVMQQTEKVALHEMETSIDLMYMLKIDDSSHFWISVCRFKSSVSVKYLSHTVGHVVIYILKFYCIY